MEFLTISDTHNFHNKIPEHWLTPADCIIHAGDVSQRGTYDEIFQFLKWFSSLKQYKYKVMIFGNHDFLGEHTKKVSELFKLFPNVICLNDSHVVLDGIKIHGTPVSPWFHDWAFNRERGKEICKHWDQIPKDTDILVTHSPAYTKCDSTHRGERVGCEDLLRYIEEIKPKYHISGHIHECGGFATNGDTFFINASVVNKNYDISNQPIPFSLS